MGDDYQWRGGSVSFSAAGSWDNFTTGQSPAQTPPGPSDTANMGDTGGTVGGNGDVAILNVDGAFTFTGNVTAEADVGFDFLNNSTVGRVSGGTLTGKQTVSITNGTVDVSNGGTLATNTGTASPGFIGDFSSVTVDNGSVATTAFGDSGSFSLADGTADISLMTVGDMPGSATTMDVGSGGTLADSSANIGSASGDDSAVTVHSGGVWTSSSNLDIGLLSTGSVDIGSGGSVSVGTSGSIVPLTMGLGGSSSASLDIAGGMMTVTGNAEVGASGAGNVSITGGGAFTVTGTLDEGVQSGGSGTLSASDGAITIDTWIIGDAGAHNDSITGPVTVDVSGALSLGAQSTGNGTLTLSGSAALTIDGGATVGAAGAGSIDIGQGSSVSLGGALTLADLAHSSGTITLGQGVALVPAGTLTVGNAGTASVTLAAGATLDGSAGAFMVGDTVGGAGTITLAGAGAAVLSNALTVGGVGAGTITIAADTTLDASGNLTLGATHGGGNGLVTVAGSGDLTVGGNMVVGAGGIGSLDVNGGGLTIDGSLDIADGPASAGDITFANATLSTGTITVGNQGTATFSANQAASVTATNIVLGQAGVGNGTFNLDGAGSQVQTSQLSVGGGGTGALQVTDSASFQVSGLATMGASASSKVQETATISSNASWTIGGILDVGQKAAGQITIDSGGQVAAAQSVVIGDTTKASGTVSVGGTGTLASALGFGSLSQVGNDGTGTLDVAAGAQVGTGITGEVEIGATAGARGLVSLTGTGSELQAQLLEVGGIAAGSGGAGTLDIAGKAEVAAAAATIWATGTVVMSGGTLVGSPISMQGGLGGFGVVTGAVDNVGAILASGGTLELSGSITGDGALQVSSGAALRLTTSVAATETIGMASSGAVLRLGKLASVKATVTGFAQGDTIVLDGVTADGGSYSASTLTLTDGTNDVGTLTMNGSYNSSEFHVATVTGGSDVTIVPCFAAGARILTAAGELAVEQLSTGDLVATRSGRLRPIKWIGHRRVEAARPVRIDRDAFAPGMPHRSLQLSPDHAVHWNGDLIPVRYLCNGATVRQESVAAVEYYHVELDAHDILLAEGLPAESYLDTGNRLSFLDSWVSKGLRPLAGSRGSAPGLT